MQLVGVTKVYSDPRFHDLPPVNGSSQPSIQLQTFLHANQLRAWSHALTIRIARIEGDREVSWNTVSGVLIELGSRAMVATAWHVLLEFRRLRLAGVTVALVCDNMPISSPRTVYRDEESDLALLELPPNGREGISAVPYRPGRAWPPSRVEVGDSVMVCGFPKLFRHDGEEILHGDLNALVVVASASERHFMLQAEWDRLVQAGRVTLSDPHSDFGGVSGGPVYLCDNGCNALVGVVAEAGQSLPIWRVSSLASVPADVASYSSEVL